MSLAPDSLQNAFSLRLCEDSHKFAHKHARVDKSQESNISSSFCLMRHARDGKKELQSTQKVGRKNLNCFIETINVYS